MATSDLPDSGRFSKSINTEPWPCNKKTLRNRADGLPSVYGGLREKLFAPTAAGPGADNPERVPTLLCPIVICHFPTRPFPSPPGRRVVFWPGFKLRIWKYQT